MGENDEMSCCDRTTQGSNHTCRCETSGSRWSLWSHDSVLSIASTGSVLSVGSAYSSVSVGSFGSSLSAFSVGSFLSVASLGSSASRGSVLSNLSQGARLAHRGCGEGRGQAVGVVALSLAGVALAGYRRRRLT